VVEPVQGRGGVIVPPRGFLAALGELCERRGALLVADEIMTGLGRCGAMLRGVADGARPDLVCLGKALGGGMPVSACIGRAQVMAAWGDPTSEALHTGTFFGNPLGCAAALAAIDAIERGRLCDHALESGVWLQETLRARIGARVRGVRGMGLLVGVELASGALGLRVVRGLLERGYIALPAAADARVLSLTPPLVIDRTLLDAFVSAFEQTLHEAAQ
jgi:4-aminobutyrate aminotransferase/(S)-3-amino-2-methylpropionate transaminase